ncbi:hypothetical protein BDV25DRAFT_136681 [Aspergillus avenaceus]|uniref:Uncharacterized protein n=1 Tax=Aspergillus avenaceus TaxID=36643 RepID=A0A5N6U4R5_ASPAV|nr:hypothetical protein BDV25DRAFT_136681 [Aspergillus avenaceus]
MPEILRDNESLYKMLSQARHYPLLSTHSTSLKHHNLRNKMKLHHTLLFALAAVATAAPEAEKKQCGVPICSEHVVLGMPSVPSLAYGMWKE